MGDNDPPSCYEIDCGVTPEDPVCSSTSSLMEKAGDIGRAYKERARIQLVATEKKLRLAEASTVENGISNAVVHAFRNLLNATLNSTGLNTTCSKTPAGTCLMSYN